MERFKSISFYYRFLHKSMTVLNWFTPAVLVALRD